MKILVTGGAGFIGSHLVDALVDKHEVVVLDNLDPQVHGNGDNVYQNPNAKYIFGDVGDYGVAWQALEDIDVVYHLAASVGVGQSMYKIYDYTKNNSCGGANLLQVLLDRKQDLKRLIVASSMSIYGEGAYYCANCEGQSPLDAFQAVDELQRLQDVSNLVYPSLRNPEQLRDKEWELNCPYCEKELAPMPTPEHKPLAPTSIYAITKRDHEEMFAAFGWAYKIPTTALRFFGVYGPRQALSNPYTGVGAVFSSRLLNNKAPLIFEDGKQTRDFIHVSDIVQGLVLSLEAARPGVEVYNLGTGRPVTVLELAQLIQKRLHFVREQNARCQADLDEAPGQDPDILQKYREGDIRHCYADITAARNRIGFDPKIQIEQGVNDLVDWVKDEIAVDRVAKATEELVSKGLL